MSNLNSKDKINYDFSRADKELDLFSSNFPFVMNIIFFFK